MEDTTLLALLWRTASEAPLSSPGGEGEGEEKGEADRLAEDALRRIQAREVRLVGNLRGIAPEDIVLP